MISNINSQPLDNSAVANNKNATTQTADASQSSLKEPSENSSATSPSTIVRLSSATAPEKPLTYTAAGTSGNIGKPPPTQTQESLEYETTGTSGGIGKPPPTQTEELETTVVGTSGGIGKPPPSPINY